MFLKKYGQVAVSPFSFHEHGFSLYAPHYDAWAPSVDSMKKNVLIVRPWDSSFIHNDGVVLRKYYDVREIKYALSRKHISSVFRSIDIVRSLLWADVVFIRFAAKHAEELTLVCKLIGKKTVVVVGGYEVASVPEIGYGAALDHDRVRRVRNVLERADKILAVSGSSRSEIEAIYLSDKIEMVYDGVDIQHFSPGDVVKESIVLTVGAIGTDTVKRKGFMTFVKAAARVPEAEFVLVGEHKDRSVDDLKAAAPCNVRFVGFQTDDELLNWYRRAKIYCQLSKHEAFGVALVEAMSCGCVPVTTTEGALEEVAGNAGFFAEYGNVASTASAIKSALNSNNEKKARERVEEYFSLQNRGEKLASIIDNL